MASSLSRPGGSAGPTLPQHLAVVCSSFYEDWKEGRRPRIEEVLERTRPFDRTTLLPHLIRIEVRHRVRLGETPRPDEYVARFPDSRDTIGSIDWRSLTPQPPMREDDVASTILAMPPRRGAVGRYELIERLGVGGFGEVWRAFDPHLQREVAIKVGHFDSADRSQATLLLHEARSAGRLRHPRIVPIHEAGTEGEVTYIVSDYIPGTNLATKLKSGPLPAKEAAGIALKLAEALAHAHDRGIVHRDVKPANVLIDPAGEPHLTDFGVARRTAGDKTISQAGQALGTPAYMSPEQARGETAAIDLRTDVYALGLVLYEMLAGRRAYPGDAREAFNAVLLGPPVPLRSLRKDVPRDLLTIVDVATAREKRDRYQSTMALADDLGLYLRGEPILGRRIGVAGRAWRLIRRPKVLMAGFGFSAFAAVLMLKVIGTPPADSDPLRVSHGTEQTSSVAATESPMIISKVHEKVVEDAKAAGVEQRLVEIRTEPGNADVWLFPLDPRTGMVQAGTLIDPEKNSPVRLTLPVGFYHIVADLGGGRFAEGVRRVPPASETRALINAPCVFWERMEGGVALNVRVPVPPPAGALVRVEGGVVEAGHRADGSVIRVEVPSFLLAPYEMTFRDYIAAERPAAGSGLRDDQILPASRKGRAFEYGHAIPLEYGEAEYIASRNGTRLPDEFEWLLAARLPMAADWDTIAADLPPEGFGTAGVPSSDRTETAPPIFGLKSNLAEWTGSWFVPIRALEDEHWPAAIERPYDFDLKPRVVRGGDRLTTMGDPKVTPTARASEIRLSADVLRRGEEVPVIGFRPARSVRPRKAESDFVRILPAEAGTE